MSSRDPRRLLDPGSELHPRLRALLQSGRDELPSSARLGQLAARLGPDFAAVRPAGVATMLARGALLPRFIVSLALAGVGSGVYLSMHDGPRAPSIAAAPNPSVVAAARAVSPDPPAPVVANPSPVPQAVAKPPAAAIRARTSQPVRVAAPDAVAELALLDDAQSALRDAPELALARTQSHAHRYPHGRYEQEREILAIEALLRLGRGTLAQLRAQRFLKRFPGSSYATRARQQLARAVAATGSEPVPAETRLRAAAQQ